MPFLKTQVDICWFEFTELARTEKADKVTAAGFELISKLGIKTIQGSSNNF